MSAADIECVHALVRALKAVRAARSLVAPTYDAHCPALCRGEMVRLNALEDSLVDRLTAARAQLTGVELGRSA